MTQKCRMLNAECGINAAASHCARSRFTIRHSRPGLTLIELLVTIVIMVTVLAGVLPLVSPNNNSRKLREASRQLNSLLSQAQAQAARDGRPVGVAFREAGTPGNYDGVALEIYTIAVPPPFAGFSESSRAVVELVPNTTYGTTGATPNGGKNYSPQYEGYPVCQIQFIAFGNDDPFPPRMLRIGDSIAVAGNTFLICDDADQTQMANLVETINGVEYLVSDPTQPAPAPGTFVQAIWTNYTPGMILPQVPTPRVGQQYKIYRQPINSSDQPLQFPRGIAIDMEGSGTEGIAGLNPPSVFDDLTGVPDVVGIMFSPNGGLEQLYLNGQSRAGVDQIHLLVGLVENGNGAALDRSDYDFANNPAADADDLAARRTRVNWLNPESRWVAINRAGRVVSAENNVSYDPNDSAFHSNGTIGEQREKQIAAARQNAKNMSGSTGR